MSAERRFRSMVKSVLWRVIGIVVLGLISFIFTGSWVVAALITFFHHLTFVFVYYFHERAWLRVKNRWLLKWRRWVRPFTYEIVLGHLILGIISFVFTGSWITVALITVVYIENKLWIYVVYDWGWGKIKWGCLR